MTGLVGIFKIKDNSLENKNLLLRMCDVIKHKEWYKVQTFENHVVGLGRVTLGILNPEVQPIYNEDKSLCIMMEGEVFDYQSNKKELRSKGHNFSINNDPEYVLHLYEEFGDDFVHKLNGSFLIAIYNNKDHELIIANDRFGSRPLYYYISGSNLIFGPEVKAILEDNSFNRVVNDEAVLDFFKYGFILENKTLIMDISLFPNASILKCSKKGFSIKNYWNLEFREDYMDYPDEYYLDKLKIHLIKAVERQIDKKRLGISLSGGLDSRTIAGIIKKIDPNLQIPFLTFGYDEKCDDVRIARMIAKELDETHFFISLIPDFLVDHAEDGIYFSDGLVGSSYFHCISALENMKKHSDILFIGTLLDSMFHSSIFDKVYKLTPNELDHKLYAKLTWYGFNENDLKDLFLETYFEKNEKLIEKSFNEIENRKTPDMLLNKWSYYIIIQENRRFIFDSVNLIRKEMEVRLPFLDNDLVDFYLTIPPGLRYDANLISRAFKQLFPELAKIPLQSTNAPVGAKKINREINSLLYKGLMRINMIAKKIHPCLALPQRKKEYHNYDTWIRECDRTREFFLKILLDERTLSRGYFKPDGIKKLIDLHMNGSKNYSRELGLLLTFELWHRMFIDERA